MLFRSPLVIRHQGEQVGLFPLFVARRWPLRIGSSPRGIDTLFLGPLVADELLGELLDCYERWARSHGISYSCIAFARQIDPATAQARGYVCERHKYRVVDLRGGPDAVWKRFESECRRRVRRAEKLGVKIVEGDFSRHYDRYVELSAEVFARSNLKTELTRPVLSGMIDTLAQAGRLLALRAEVDGKVVAMWVGGHYGKTMFALNTVSDRAFVECSANNLMNWHAIQWSCERGLEAFDFGGSRIQSLAAFKASFGAEELFYGNIKKVHGPLARTAVWMADVTVNKLRARWFRRSQKGSVQSRLRRPQSHGDAATRQEDEGPTHPSRQSE